MKKIFLLVLFVMASITFGQRYNPYETTGWDLPWGFTGEDSTVIPPWTYPGGTMGYYGLGIMEINSNPGGWLNYNYWKIDSLLQALVVYTVTSQIILENDTLKLAPMIAAAIDTQYSPFWLDFAGIEADSVSFKEGRLFYDDTGKSFGMMVEEPDVTLNVGREIWIRGYNNTGSLITNGTPVYGVPDLTYGGLFRLGSAEFDTSSTVVGVATHDIESGSYGYATRYGLVRGVNTSGLALGSIYLDSTAGGIIPNKPPAPHNVLKLGACGLVDATNGIIFVDLAPFSDINGIADLGFVGETETITVTVISTPYQITNATSDLYIYNQTIGHDITLADDTLVVAEAGVYLFTLSFSFEGLNLAVYQFELYQSDGTTRSLVPNANALRKTSGTDVGNCGFNVMVKAAAGDGFSFWVQNTGTTGDLIMKSSTISVEQVR